ncbi:MAG TPA: CAP domain-containing protein [Patescibacteria group bacterium]
MSIFKFLRHLFIPHKTNNHRAKIIHNQSIIAVVLLLLGASFVFSVTKHYYPQVLGISANISSQDLLLLTNVKRAEAGLPPLQLNDELAHAAEGKAQDMFAKQYWAHFAPDGTSPWDFIHGAGYNYVYAGENLARGFTTAQDTINAWMASPDHRANMLSPHYTDVGFAVGLGPLPGDAETVLVVEEFGSRANAPAKQVEVPPVVVISVTPTPAPVVAALGEEKKVTPTPTPTTPVLAVVKNNPVLDSAMIAKIVSLFLLGVFLVVFAIDMIVTEQRKTVRLAGHSFDHLLFLLGILAIAIGIGAGIVG